MSIWGESSSKNLNLFLVEQGKGFVYRNKFTLDADEIINFVFNPTAYTGNSIRTLTPSFAATSGPIDIEIYAGTVSSENGTLQSLFNRNARSSIVTSATLRINPTITADGLLFSSFFVPSTGLNPSTSNPSVSALGSDFIIDQSYKYLIRCTNRNGAGTKLEVLLEWYET